MRLEPGKCYHIYNRGNNSQNIFMEEKNYHFFLERFKKYLSEHLVVYAYSLMQNHFHFLVKIKDFEFLQTDKNVLSPVEKAFRNFFISYAKAINEMYKRTGSLFQYKFKRKEISADSYFSWLIFYIHANPLKSGIDKNLSEWDFSSYRHILSDEQSFLEKKEVLDWFGGEQSFIEFHQTNLKELNDRKEDFWL